jgi:hypothetical protein
VVWYGMVPTIPLALCEQTLLRLEVLHN